jgi:hypothetical protein
MKRILFLFCLLLPLGAFCQADSIYLHSGAVIGGHVQDVLPNMVAYTTWQTGAPKILSRHAVQKIIYSTGKEEVISQVITIDGEGDWQQVVVLSDKAETAGLSYAGEVDAAGGGKYIAIGQAESEALTRLKKETARLKCPFLFISSSHTRETGYVGRRVKKSGVAYRY